MNPLLATLIQAGIEYTFALIDRYKKDNNGEMPTKEQLMADINTRIASLLSDGQAWKDSKDAQIK